MDTLVKIPVSISGGEVILKDLIKLTLSNPAAFQDETTGDARFGTVDEYGRVYIKKAILDKLLKEKGIIARDFMHWAKANEYIKCDESHFSIMKRLRGENKIFRCVCISAKLE